VQRFKDEQIAYALRQAESVARVYRSSWGRDGNPDDILTGMRRRSVRTLAAVSTLFCVSIALARVGNEFDRITDLLVLSPGLVVADVGAGDGEFSEAMARRVGKEGHVYINEIDDGELIKIRRRVSTSDLSNMTIVEGTPEDTNLAESCCAAILLRFVYHHASRPEELSGSLLRSSAPGGRLLVIEKDQQNHGISADQLIEEMTARGFEVVLLLPEWEGASDHYAVVFQRYAGRPGSSEQDPRRR
jgi:ubiquinone/menaquinone biosynthesis C-methylase UbiE